MKRIISALHFEWKGMNECIGRAVDEFGLDGVECSWADIYERPHCTDTDLDELTSIGALRDLTLSAHIWENPAQDDVSKVQQNLLGWLRLCEKTCTTDLVVHGGTFPDQRAGLANVRRMLEGVLPAFERKGVVLNLENHYAYDYHDGNELLSEPWEFKEIFSLDSPSLGFCFDTGHGNMTKNSEALIRELAPWLRYIHMADNQGTDDDHDMFRKGTVEWDRVFSLLQEIGFDGIFCVEFPVYEDQAPFRQCMKEIQDRWNGAGGE